MSITSVSVRGFRCFDRYDLELDPHITIIAGPNGSGKSSLLEAMHVGATLRSFRTSGIRELIHQGTEAFSIKMSAGDEYVQIGYGANTRIAEMNGQTLVTRQQLFENIPVVALTEEDILLIQGAPEARRSFLDGVAARHIPEYRPAFRAYAQVVRQRTRLLHNPAFDRDTYELLTDQLWATGQTIREMRRSALQEVEKHATELLSKIVPFPMQMAYRIPAQEMRNPEPIAWCREMEVRERAMGRSLCGPHLDELSIGICEMQARKYASRGTQKLAVVMLKLAHAQMLGPKATILLDDIMADFDEERLAKILELMVTLKLQTVLTLPTRNTDTIIALLQQYGASARAIMLPSSLLR